LRQEVYTEKSKAGSRIRFMNIITLAYEMAQTVEVFIQKARRFFYSVMLMGYSCPKCNGSLTMAGEGKCKCKACSYEFDPTIEFQRCPECNGKPVLLIRKYHCQHCAAEIESRFMFDGSVFNPEYFKEKMAESRQRKEEQRQHVRQMLAESRYPSLSLQSVDLDSVPGLLDALNGLTAGLDAGIEVQGRDEFDLNRYESHIQDHIHDFPLALREIPPLSEDTRKDLIWRFVAIIFLAHIGIVDIWQDENDIMVIKHETDTKRQGVFGEFEEADRVERLLGRVEA